VVVCNPEYFLQNNSGNGLRTNLSYTYNFNVSGNRMGPVGSARESVGESLNRTG
jgi:hypothetical protein